MLQLVRLEFLKVFKLGKIYIGFFCVLFFTLISFPGYLGNSEFSVFDLQITCFSNFLQTFFFVFSLGFACYIVGVEKQEKTLKIMRSKPVATWEIILAKYIVGLVYVVMQFVLMMLFVFLLGSLFNPYADFSNLDNTGMIPVSYGVKITLLIYTVHVFTVFFVVALAQFLSLVFEKVVLAFISLFFFIVVNKILENLEPVKSLLPTYNINSLPELVSVSIDWHSILPKLLIMLVYSGILFLLTSIIYQRKDVSI